jgi:rhodanese-related sulfurtransferase
MKSFNPVLYLIAVSFFLSVFLLFSCKPQIPDSELLTVNEALKFLKENKGSDKFILLDVRTQKEYDEAHIDNPRLIDFYRPDFNDELAKLDKSKTYIIYCRTDNRSAKTLQMMKDLGFMDVRYIIGGIIEWKKQNLPLNF